MRLIAMPTPQEGKTFTSRRLHRASRRAGFTLLEVLLVVGILVALAALVVPNLIGSQEQAQIQQTQVQVLSLDKQVKEYKITTKQWPPSLDALYTPPNPQPTGWRPFVERPDFTDAWGQQLNYQVPGSRNNLGNPDIWSNGVNGVNGDADDIGNWSTGK